MIKLENHHYLLFDGDCGICTSFAEAAKRMDRKSRFVIEPYQNYPEDELGTWGITYAACTRKMQAISQTGRVYSGAFAFNYFFYHQFPWSLLLIPVYIVPIFLLFEMAGYALVARNRHRISRWFGLKACLVRAKPAMPGTRENSNI
jgi:predicted DCC family thiol-disulfide oxidoreductase YuxK